MSCSFQYLRSLDNGLLPIISKDVFPKGNLRLNGQSIYLFLTQSDFPPIPKNRLAECRVRCLY